MKIFDLHCDTATALHHAKLPFDNQTTHINKSNTAGHRLTQCFAVFFPDRLSQAEAEDLFFSVVDGIFPQLNTPEVSPILTVEGGGVLAGREDWISLLAEKNCAMASLVWNGKNPLATGAVTDDNAPLTQRGKDAVKELIANNITVDVSHLSRRGAEEILNLTDTPIAASHSNARGVTPHVRNLSDETAKEIFRRGGLVGLNLYPPFLSEEKASTEDLLRHAEHLLKLGGEGGLALGCDLDGVTSLPAGMKDFGDLPALHRRFCQAFGTALAENIFYNNAARFFGRE